MARKAERLQVLDQLTPPDLWPDIRGREPRRPPEEPRTRRALVAALALAIAAAAIAFAVRAFEVAEQTPRPASTVENGLLAFSGAGQIHVVSPDGSGLRQLTDPNGHDALDVHWSPDGSKLGFRVWTKGDYELFVTNADGSGLTNVTGSMGVSEFAWSPNGSILAFTAFQEANDFDIFVVNADGTGLRAVVESPLSEHRPQWSPDGTQIAFERWPVYDRDPGTPDIYTVGLDRDEPVPLVTSSGWDTGAAWSPDGTRIAFSGERDGDQEIYVVNADGSGEEKLTDLPGLDATTAAWSPDGTKISLVAHDGEQWDVWIVNTDGGGLLKLTPSDRDDGPAAWAPDGSLLAFTASKVISGVDNTGTYDVYTIRPDGTDERRITFGRLAMGWDLSWQPVSATVATPRPTETAPVAVNPRVTATIPVGSIPRDVAVGARAVWVTVNNFIRGNEDHSVVRVDPATNEIVATIALRSPGHIAIGAGAVWTINHIEGPDTLVRIDPSSNRVVATIPVGHYAFDVAAVEGAVWVTRDIVGAGLSGEVIRIDPATNEVVARIPVEGRIRDVVVGEAGIWVVDSTSTSRKGPSLIHIDPETNRAVATIPGLASLNVATGDGYVWVHGWFSAIDPSIGPGAEDRLVVLRIDPQTDEIVGDPISMEWFYPFAFDEGGVWFVDKAGPSVSRLNTQTLEIDHSVTVDAVAQDSTVHAAFDMSTGTIWVANTEDKITRIDLR